MEKPKLKALQTENIEAFEVPFGQVVVIGISGKMYLPQSQQDLNSESFAYETEIGADRELIKRHWDAGGEIEFFK